METEQLDKIDERLREQIKDLIHWYGKERLLEIIDEVEELNQEAAFNRKNNDY